jgi:hypothetical protein
MTYDFPVLWSGGFDWSATDYAELVTNHATIKAYWPLDETGVTPTAIDVVNGIDCTSVSIDGAGGDILVPNQADLSRRSPGNKTIAKDSGSGAALTCSDGWAWEAWIHPTNIASQPYTMLTTGAGDEGPEVRILTGGILRLRNRGDSTQAYTVAGTIEVDQTYHIVCGQTAGGTAFLYINGSAVSWDYNDLTPCTDDWDDFYIAYSTTGFIGDLSHWAWYTGTAFYGTSDARDHYYTGLSELPAAYVGVGADARQSFWHSDDYTDDLDLTQTSKPTLMAAVNSLGIRNALQSANWRMGRDGWFGKLQPSIASLRLKGLADAQPGDPVVFFCETQQLWSGSVDEVLSERDTDALWYTTIGAVDRIAEWGLNLTLEAAYANGSATNYTDYADYPYSGDLIGFINRQEEIGNLAVAQTRSGVLRYLTRQSSSTSAWSVLPLVGIDSPSRWSERLSSAETYNRWYAENTSGTAYLDYSIPSAIVRYDVRDLTFDGPESWTHTGFGNWEDSLLDTVSSPRPTVEEGTFYITSRQNSALAFDPLDLVEHLSEIWSLMEVQHEVTLDDWKVTVSAERSNNYINGDAEDGFDYPPAAYQTFEEDANWNREEVNYGAGAGWEDSGNWPNFFVGKLYGAVYRCGLEFPAISWPANTVSVVSAKLFLTYESTPYAGGNPRIVAKPFTRDPSTNWPNVPAVVALEQQKWWNGSLLSDYDQIYVDVTDIAAAWLNGDVNENGIKLTVLDETINFQNYGFWNLSEDNGTTILAPHLEITVLKSA